MREVVKWTSEFSYDFTLWSLLVSVNFGKYYWEIGFLCFRFSRYAVFPENESPEEQLRQLDEYTDEQLKYMADERTRIMALFGTQTGER